MAEVALETLLDKLKNLHTNHSHLTTENKKQIEYLEINLRIINAMLKGFLKNQLENTEIDFFNRNDVVNEVEDEINDFIALATERKSTSSFFKFWKPSISLHDIDIKLQEVKEKVERARTHFANIRFVGARFWIHEVRPPRERYMAGYAGVCEGLIHHLTTQTDYFDVVCLTGMGGLGKTTLASKIFSDKKISNAFPVRIWLSISQVCSHKDIFLTMLEQLSSIITDDIRQKNDKELARIVAGYLQSTRYLIVFDDVWNCDDWEKLRQALPNNANQGKVLITSRNEYLGVYACKPGPTHKMH